MVNLLKDLQGMRPYHQRGKWSMKDTEFEDKKIVIIPKTMHLASLEWEGQVPDMQGLCDGLKD